MSASDRQLRQRWARRATQCRDWIEDDSGRRPCEESGVQIKLSCPAGRPDAIGGPYCEKHGARDRSEREARAEWNFAAPESVGDAASVERAGQMHLDTTHAYVVVRPERELWLAWLGLGSLLMPVASAANRADQSRLSGNRRHRPYYAFISRETAIARAREVSIARTRTEVEQIRQARGGTLAWGIEVSPLDSPIVVEPGEHGSAWDAAVALPRIAPIGMAMISGLRSSGEAS